MKRKTILLLPLILFVLFSCSRQEDIRGTFVNENSEEITIDCNYQFTSTNLSGKPLMPENGAKITLISNSLQAEQITMSFMWDSINSPFATWDRNTDKITIRNHVYTRKSYADCSD